MLHRGWSARSAAAAFSFCSATILSSCTCALLYASTTCSGSSRAPGSGREPAWLHPPWTRSHREPESPAPPAVGPLGREARKGGRVEWLVGCLPPARGNARYACARRLHKGRMLTGPLDEPQTQLSARTAPVTGRLLRSWTQVSKTLDRFAVGGALVLAALLSSSAARAGDPATLRARSSACARRTTGSPLGRRPRSSISTRSTPGSERRAALRS